MNSIFRLMAAMSAFSAVPGASSGPGLPGGRPHARPSRVPDEVSDHPKAVAARAKRARRRERDLRLLRTQGQDPVRQDPVTEAEALRLSAVCMNVASAIFLTSPDRALELVRASGRLTGTPSEVFNPNIGLAELSASVRKAVDELFAREGIVGPRWVVYEAETQSCRIWVGDTLPSGTLVYAPGPRAEPPEDLRKWIDRVRACAAWDDVLVPERDLDRLWRCLASCDLVEAA